MSTIGDWQDLPTNYEDARYSGDRKFEMKKNADNTVSLTDVTAYENEDVSRTFFGAAEANQINGGMNKLVGAVNDVINIMYPVGSIYMSVNPVNPETLFGGTWGRIQDRFLLAAGSTFSGGTTGGNKDAVVVSHTHTQVEHTHNYPTGDVKKPYYKLWGTKSGLTEEGAPVGGTGKYYTASGEKDYKWLGLNTMSSEQPSINTTGVDGTDKNMPPYIAVYVWERLS